MNHTPGPWKPFQNDDEGIHLLNDRDVIVCEQIHTNVDARLIAAAPEMLALLYDMLRPEDLHTNAETLIERWTDQARVLLARIEGR